MKEHWPYLLIACAPPLEEPLTAVLFSCGCIGTSALLGSAGDGPPARLRLTAWFADRESRDEAARRLRRTAAELDPDRPPLVEAGLLESEDWLARWREGLKPFPVGRRLLVLPGEDDPVPAEHAGRLALRITPGLAFGTGHHQTTRFCLERLEAAAGEEVEVLDVGTGSGILAVAAALLGCRRVVATEIDPRAAAVAAANIDRHGLARRVGLLVTGNPEAAGLRPFSLVAANILGSTLLGMAPVLAGPLLAPGGRLLLAGILAGDEEREVLRAYRDLGLDCAARQVDGEWAGLVMSRPAG